MGENPSRDTHKAHTYCIYDLGHMYSVGRLRADMRTTHNLYVSSLGQSGF